MPEEPLYYAKEPGPKNGRIGTVWARPVETKHENGSTSSTMGFKVCDCNEYVEGAATIIADALNKMGYWREGAALIEGCLAKAAKADPQDAPFPLVGDEAALWFQAQADAFRHALEMMGPPNA